MGLNMVYSYGLIGNAELLQFWAISGLTIDLLQRLRLPVWMGCAVRDGSDSSLGPCLCPSTTVHTPSNNPLSRTMNHSIYIYFGSLSDEQTNPGVLPRYVRICYHDDTFGWSRYTLDWEQGKAPWSCNVANVANLGGGHPIAGQKDTFRIYFGGADTVLGCVSVRS